MLKIYMVENVKWGGGKLSFYCVIDAETDVPLPAPSSFLLSVAKKNPCLNTSRAYAQVLKDFFTVLNESAKHVNWKSVTDGMMSHYIYGYLKKKRRLGDRSIGLHITVLSLFYSWAYSDGFIDSPKAYSFATDGDDKPLKVQGGDRHTALRAQYLSRNDFDLLLSSVEGSDPFVIERNELTLCLGYYAGLRAVETIDPRNFQTEDVAEILRLTKQKGKMECDIEIVGKGEKLRKVKIKPELFARIDRFINGRRKILPSGPMICSVNGVAIKTKQFASNVFTDAKISCEKCTDERWMNYSFHGLRHTYATDLVTWCYETKVGDPWQIVPEYMGHEDVQTTRDYVFLEAVMNNRIELIEKLSLQKSSYNKRYKEEGDDDV
ncbi:MAG: site-specific integrase [Sedimenticola sp.]